MASTASGWADILFSGDASPAVLSWATQRGRLRCLARDICTGDITSERDEVVHRLWGRIVGREFPGAVIADRSVPDGGLARDDALVVVHSHQRPVALPGVVIYPRPGHGPTIGDITLPDGLWISSTERVLLDNLVPARSHATAQRALDQARIEARIEQLLQQRGEEGLNVLSDRARAVSESLDRRKEIRELDRLISAALLTRDDVAPAVPVSCNARSPGSAPSSSASHSPRHPHLAVGKCAFNASDHPGLLEEATNHRSRRI